MSEKVPKNEYVISEEEEIEEEEEEEGIEEEEIDLEKNKKGLSEEEIEERKKKQAELKNKRREEQQKKEQNKIRIKNEIKGKVKKILSKGKVTSKATMTNLLIKRGIQDYYFKTNLLTNEIKPEIEYIGASLKELRFGKEIKFRIVEGSHVYYMKNWKTEIKTKEYKVDFNWRTYRIPEGNNEIYIVIKIPGSFTDSHHFLSSCFPDAQFWGFKLNVDKKFRTTRGFKIIHKNIWGNFDGDKLIIGCRTSSKSADKTVYKLIQIGRRIVEEMIKLNWRSSELIVINNLNDTLYLPIVPIFRARDRNAFYETKFVNALRLIYDFPQKFEKKDVYGKFSILSKELKDDQFEIKNYYDFIDKSFVFQTKSFLTNAILNDWIINPAKALNYTKEDEEIKKLVDEYTQEIETDRIIQERLEERMEKSEFLKEMTTNLLLTLLGVSFWANEPILQGVVIGVFIAINLLYIYLRAKRYRKKIF
ncbi:MAG: hypothetical protein ACFFAS_02090 [Promethearchaeota archaeon]